MVAKSYCLPLLPWQRASRRNIGIACSGLFNEENVGGVHRDISDMNDLGQQRHGVALTHKGWRTNVSTVAREGIMARLYSSVKTSPWSEGVMAWKVAATGLVRDDAMVA